MHFPTFLFSAILNKRIYPVSSRSQWNPRSFDVLWRAIARKVATLAPVISGPQPPLCEIPSKGFHFNDPSHQNAREGVSHSPSLPEKRLFTPTFLPVIVSCFEPRRTRFFNDRTMSYHSISRPRSLHRPCLQLSCLYLSARLALP
jgi:hypothetical protein